MPKLVRQVTSPRMELRLRYVLAAAACICAGLVGLSRELDEPGYPRERITRADERRILDEFELWSKHVCPRGIEEFTIQHDPWGNPYRLLCEAGLDRVTLAVVSVGSEDVGAEDATVTSRTYSP